MSSDCLGCNTVGKPLSMRAQLHRSLSCGPPISEYRRQSVFRREGTTLSLRCRPIAKIVVPLDSHSQGQSSSSLTSSLRSKSPSQWSLEVMTSRRRTKSPSLQVVAADSSRCSAPQLITTSFQGHMLSLGEVRLVRNYTALDLPSDRRPMTAPLPPDQVQR